MQQESTMTLRLVPNVFIAITILLSACAGDRPTETRPSANDARQKILATIMVVARDKVVSVTDEAGVVYAAQYNSESNMLHVIIGAEMPVRAIGCADGPQPDGLPEWCLYGVVQRSAVPDSERTALFWGALLALTQYPLDS